MQKLSSEEHHNTHPASKNLIQSDMSSSEDDESVEEKLEKSDNRVQVCLRLRPMNRLEVSRRSKNCVEVVHDDDEELAIVDSPLEGEYEFSLDRVSHIVFAMLVPLGVAINAFPFIFLE